MKLKAVLGFIVLFAVYHASEILGNPIIILTAFLLFFAAAQMVAKLLGEKGISAFGLRRHKGARLNLFAGYVLGFLFYTGSFVVSVMSGKIHFEGLFSFQQMIFPVLGIALITFLSSACEDILTRGYVFTYFPKKHSLTSLVIVSSFIYVLNHIWRIENGYTEWILLFLMGLTYAIPYAATGSLWFTIGCHWGWNTVSLFKNQIGNMSDFKVVDHTSNWVYIFTMVIFLVFVSFYSKFFLKRVGEDENNILLNKANKDVEF